MNGQFSQAGNPKGLLGSALPINRFYNTGHHFQNQANPVGEKVCDAGNIMEMWWQPPNHQKIIAVLTGMCNM